MISSVTTHSFVLASIVDSEPSHSKHSEFFFIGEHSWVVPNETDVWHLGLSIPLTMVEITYQYFQMASTDLDPKLHPGRSTISSFRPYGPSIVPILTIY